MAPGKPAFASAPPISQQTPYIQVLFARAQESHRSGHIADAVAGVETLSDDLNDDHHGSAAYRAHLVNVMTRRAVAGAA